MTDAELMLTLFEGSDLAHGRSELTNEISHKGKHETKSWTEKRAANLEDWEAHLAGIRGLGILPLASTNRVKWGAIDVDVYEGLSLEDLNQAIQVAGLPLVICRSKSGGPHIFLFVQEWTPAQAMIEKLEAIAGYLGFGTSEIFPKQAMIHTGDKNPDFGSWINMPYFAGTKFLRYGINEKNEALITIPEFYTYVEQRRLTPEQFTALKPPVPQDLLPGGPPCLNQLMAKRPDDFRNVILSNIAVYLKKRHGPTDWQAQLDQYNAKFSTPLPSNEVETIKRSYSNKDYRYQCSKQPLCSFCDSSACKKVAFGIGGKDLMPASRSLTMMDTNPPVWYLDVDLPNGDKRRISLTTEQLQNPRLFQRRCMEALQQMPPSVKMEEWEPVVAQLMEHVTVIRFPPELSPEGQFKELLLEFLSNRATDDSFEDLTRGLPFKNNEGFHFRLRDVHSFMKTAGFQDLKKHEMTLVITSDLKGVKGFKNIKGKGVNYLTIPYTEETKQEPLTVNVPSPVF